MEQEQAFLNALTKVTTSRMEGDRLELRGADGALAAAFRRAGTD
jgi:heat shock protein HslJ